ncbi:MAG: tetratricopeptide repeat protein [Spirochaetaceae bacterium]|nr:tetratricopeptide repeat protein [Myxococcales bacterium]MCB9724852.1 tetratricopeptide repeat protein [Spirochaetaceae bacterium]
MLARSLVLLTAVVASVCAVTSPAFADPSPTRADDWRVTRTRHFEIFSSTTEEETRELAVELERFHALILVSLGGVQGELALPTRVFAFDRRSDYDRFAPNRTDGVFRAGTRTNDIVLFATSRGRWAREAAFHEYVHCVLRSVSSVRYPLWYEEGFADLLSTARVHKGAMAIGAVPKRRVDSLRLGRWMSTTRLVSGRSYGDFVGRHRAMLYAQGWALVHYLSLDRERSGSVVQELSRHLALLAVGASPEAAFHEAFGESADSAGRNLRKRLVAGGFRAVAVPLAELDTGLEEPVVAGLPLVETSIRLGELALNGGDAQRAEVEFRAALGLDPARARAEAGLGTALRRQDRWAEAAPHFERAIEIDPGDPLNHLDLGNHLFLLAMQEGRVAGLSAILERARTAYARSLELDPARIETQAMLGAIHLAPGGDPANAVRPLERALERLPSSLPIRNLLVEAYVANGREREARATLEAAIADSGDDAAGSSIEDPLASIRARRSEVEARGDRLAEDGRLPGTEASGSSDSDRGGS